MDKNTTSQLFTDIYSQLQMQDQMINNYKRLAMNTAEQELLKTQTLEEQSLFKTNYKEWRQRFSPEIQNLFASYQGSIAPMMANSLGATLDLYSNINVFTHRQYNTRFGIPDDTINKVALRSFFKNYGKSILDQFTPYAQKDKTNILLKRVPTGDAALKHNFIYANNVLQTEYAMRSALLNIAKQNAFIAWDLEGMSGKNLYGQQHLTQLTEFTFGAYDAKGKALLDASGNEIVFGSVIGSNAQQDEIYGNIIDKAKRGKKLTEEENVILKRLKLAGASAAHLSQVQGKDAGIFRYTQFATASEIENMGLDVAELGQKSLRNLGITQSTAAKVSYGGQDMYAWEKEFFEGLDSIRTNNYTSVGFNIMGYDIQMVNRFLANGLHSEGAQRYVEKFYSGGFQAKYTFDQLAALRAYGQKDAPTTSVIETAKKINATIGQLETINTNLTPDFYDMAAHTSVVDIKAVANLFTQGLFDLNGGENSIFKEDDLVSLNSAKKDITLTGGNNKLFYATKSLDANQYNLISFTHEAFSDTFFTNNGYNVSADGADDVGWEQWGVQRGVSYSIDNVYQIKPDEKLRSSFAAINLALDENMLYAITIRPETDEAISTNNKAITPTTFIGTKEHIENAFGHVFLQYGAKDKDGNWKLDKLHLTQKEQELLNFVTVGNKNVSRTDINKQLPKQSVQAILAESREKLLDEGAARDRRDFKYSRDAKLKAYIDAMDAYVENDKTGPHSTPEEIEAKRQKFRQESFDKATDTAKRIAAGEKVGAEDLGVAYQTLGYYDNKRGRYNLYRNTMDKQTASEDFYRKNKDVYERAIAFAEEKGGADPQARQFYYKQFMRAVQAKGFSKYGEEALGGTITPIHAYERADKFEINLQGFKDNRSLEADVFTINLNATGYGLGQRLLSHQGLEDLSEGAQASELAYLQQQLIKKGIITGKAATDEQYKIDPNQDYAHGAEAAGRKLTAQLNQQRAQDPNSGIIKDTLHYSVRNYKLQNFGLNPEELNSIEANLKNTKYAFSYNVVKLSGKSESQEIGSAADDIVDNILFDRIGKNGRSELQEIMYQTGFTKAQATNMLTEREIRRKEMRSFMYDVLKSVIKNNGSFAYSTDNKALFIAGEDGDFKRIDNLAFDKFHNGTMYTQIGGTKTINSYGYYYVGGKNKYLTAGSRILKARDKVWWFDSAIRKAADEGDMVDVVQNIFSRFGQELRSTSSITADDAQDIRASNYFDAEGVIKAFPAMDRAGFFKEHKIEPDRLPNKEIDNNSPYTTLHNFLEQYRKNGWKYDQEVDDFIPSNVRLAINMFLPEWIRSGAINKYIERQNTNASDFKTADASIIPNVSVNTKKAGEAKYTTNDNKDFGELYTTQKRREANQMDRAFRFNATILQDRINRKMFEGTVFQDTTIGRAIESEQRLAQLEHNEGLLYRSGLNLKVTRVMATTSSIRNMVANADIESVIRQNPKMMQALSGKTDKEITKAAEDLRDYMTLIDTHEGSSAISSYMMDEAFSNRTSMQKVNALKLADDNNIILNDLKRYHQTAPMLRIEDGKITFDYRNGFFVQAGERLTYIKGYKEAQKSVIAKQTGMVRFGVFSNNGQLARKEDIEALIENSSYKDELAAALQASKETPNNQFDEGMMRAQTIFNKILSENGFERYLYNEALEAQAHIKIAEMSAEKGMAKVLVASPGSFNEDIKATFKELLGEDALEYNEDGKIIKRYGYSAFADIVPNRKFLDSLVTFDDKENELKSASSTDFSKSDFVKVIQGLRNRQDGYISSVGIEETIKKRFGSLESFHQALYAERNLVSEALQGIAQQAGLVSEDQKVQVLSNTASAEKKHQNPVQLERAVFGLQRLGKNDYEIADILQPVLPGLKVKEISYGDGHTQTQIVAPDNNMQGINLDALDAVRDKYLVRKDTDGNTLKYYISKDGKTMYSKDQYDSLSSDEKQDINVFNQYVTDKYTFTDNKTKKQISEEDYYKLSTAQKQNVSIDKFEVGDTNVRQMANYDDDRIHSVFDASGKRGKMTYRNIDMMRHHTYSDNIVALIKSRLEDTLGEKGTQIYQKYYGDAMTRKDNRVLGGVIDNMMEHLYAAPGEDLLAVFDSKKQVTDFNPVDANATKEQREAAERLNTIAQEKAQNARQRLIREGIAAEDIDAITEVARQKGASGVSSSFIRNTYTMQKFNEATEFNSGRNKLSVEDMAVRGFHTTNIADVVTETHSSMSDHLDNSIYGNNTLLDLRMKGLSDADQIFKEGDNLLALPYLSKKFMENHDMTQSLYQKEISGLAHLMKNYQTDLASGELITEQEKTQRKNEIVAKRDAARQAIMTEFTGKHQIAAKASEVILGDSAILTTAGLQLTGDEQNAMLKNMHFEGINLVDMAEQVNASKGAKGLDLGYAIASEKAMHRFYNDAYIGSIANDLGLGDDLTNQFKSKLENELQTGGTLSTNSRDPQGYVSSTNVNALYFNKTIKGDQVAVSAALQEAMKNDNDSDKITLGILKGKADISYTDAQGNTRTVTRDLDYASYKTLSQMDGFSVNLHAKTAKLFGDAVGSMFYDAAAIHPQYYSGDAMERVQNGGESASLRTSHLNDLTIGGGSSGARIIRPLTEYSAQEINQKQSAFAQIKQDYFNDVGENAREMFDNASPAERRSILADWAKTSGYYQGDSVKEQNFFDALAFSENQTRLTGLIDADTRKKGAGEINSAVYKFYTHALNPNAFTGEQMLDIMQIHTALDEAFLSPKNNRDEKPNYEYVSKVRNAMQDVYSSAKSGNATEQKRAQEKLKTVLEDTLQGREGKELSKLTPILMSNGNGGVSALRANPDGNIRTDKRMQVALGNFVSVASKVDLSQAPDSVYKQGTSAKGLAYNDRVMVEQNNKGSINEVFDTANRAEEIRYGNKINPEVVGAAPSAHQQIDTPSPLENSELSKIVPRAESSGSSNLQQELVDDMGRAAKRLKTRGIVGGAIAGMAGGIMLAGYGSTPSAPAETQAMGANQQQQEQYPMQPPMLADQNLNATGSAPQSYNINISGRSPSQDLAMNTISNAIASQIPNSTSVNMQMNTSFADKINQLQMNRLVHNSLFGG